MTQPDAPSEAEVAPDRLPTILVVEDEFLIRMDIAEELRLAGWSVYEAGTADAAIELLSTPIIVDLVLTDVQMPGRRDGIALAEFVRSERPAVRIAVMSGHHIPNPQQRHLYDGFFAKPFLAERIAKQLRALVERKTQDD